MAARRTPKVFAGAALSPADQLLSAMRTVKAARFNAAERLERKNTLSMFSMSIVSLYFVGLSVWQEAQPLGTFSDSVSLGAMTLNVWLRTLISPICCAIFGM